MTYNRRFRVCAHITLQKRKIPSHTLKKSRSLWPVRMDDSAPTHKRRTLVNTTKMCSLENGLWFLRGMRVDQLKKKL